MPFFHGDIGGAAAASSSSIHRMPVAADRSQLQQRLEKLGIRSKLDLALHLPLRYEDETKLTPLAQARSGVPVLVEAEVVEAKVEYRGRRTLVVKLTDGEREIMAEAERDAREYEESMPHQYTVGRKDGYWLVYEDGLVAAGFDTQEEALAYAAWLDGPRTEAFVFPE